MHDPTAEPSIILPRKRAAAMLAERPHAPGVRRCRFSCNASERGRRLFGRVGARDARYLPPHGRSSAHPMPMHRRDSGHRRAGPALGERWVPLFGLGGQRLRRCRAVRASRSS
jgi:hypothetical protein